MGTYLAKPVTEKESEEGELHEYLQYGVSAMQGWRKSMEDEHIAVELEAPAEWRSRDGVTAPAKVTMFAVWDGHGGKEVAKYVRRHMHTELVGLPEYHKGDIDGALVRVFHRIDEMLWDPASHDELDELKHDGATKPTSSESMDEDEDEDDQRASGDRARSESMSKEVMELLKSILTAQQGVAAAKAEDEDYGDEDNGHIRDKARAKDDHGEISAKEGGDDDMPNAPSVIRSRLAMRKAGGAAASDNDDDDNGDSSMESAGGSSSSSFSSGIVNRPQVCNLPDVKVTAGCTSVVALVVNSVLYVANAGDSRGVLCRGGVAVALSEDHKPGDPEETRRIEKVGGFVNVNGRVNGNLNLSRSIGDLKYKQSREVGPAEQMITAQPDIRRFDIQAEDEFMILACDGIWDCMTNQEAVDFTRQRLQAGMSPMDVTKEACDFCLSEDPRKTTGIGGDNMTCMVVVFKSL